MALFKAYKLNVEILDEDFYTEEEMIAVVKEAIYAHCEVRHVSVELVEFEEDVISSPDCEFAEA
jgi:hypothetical protein